MKVNFRFQKFAAFFLIIFCFINSTCLAAVAEEVGVVKERFAANLARLGGEWTLALGDMYVLPLPDAFHNNPHVFVQETPVPDKVKLDGVLLTRNNANCWVGRVNDEERALQIELPDALQENGLISIRQGDEAINCPIAENATKSKCVLAVPEPLQNPAELLEVATYYRDFVTMQAEKTYEGEFRGAPIEIIKVDPRRYRTSLLYAIYGVDRLHHRLGVFLNLGEDALRNGFIQVYSQNLAEVKNKLLPDEKAYDGAKIYQTVELVMGWDLPSISTLPSIERIERLVRPTVEIWARDLVGVMGLPASMSDAERMALEIERIRSFSPTSPSIRWVINWISSMGIADESCNRALGWLETAIRGLGEKVARDPLESRHIKFVPLKFVPPLPEHPRGFTYYYARERRRALNDALIVTEDIAKFDYAKVHVGQWESLDFGYRGHVFDFVPSAVSKIFPRGTTFGPLESLTLAGAWNAGVYTRDNDRYTRISPGEETVVNVTRPLHHEDGIAYGGLDIIEAAKEYFEDLSYSRLKDLTLTMGQKIKYEDFKASLRRMSGSLRELTIKRNLTLSWDVTPVHFSLYDYKDLMLNVLPELINLHTLDLFFNYEVMEESITTEEAAAIARNIIGLTNLRTLKLTLPYVKCFGAPDFYGPKHAPICNPGGWFKDLHRKCQKIVYEQFIKMANYLGEHAPASLEEIKFYNHRGFSERADRDQIMWAINSHRRNLGRPVATIVNDRGAPA